MVLQKAVVRRPADGSVFVESVKSTEAKSSWLDILSDM